MRLLSWAGLTKGHPFTTGVAHATVVVQMVQGLCDTLFPITETEGIMNCLTWMKTVTAGRDSDTFGMT